MSITTSCLLMPFFLRLDAVFFLLLSLRYDRGMTTFWIKSYAFFYGLRFEVIGSMSVISLAWLFLDFLY